VLHFIKSGSLAEEYHNQGQINLSQSHYVCISLRVPNITATDVTNKEDKQHGSNVFVSFLSSIHNKN